MGIADPEDWQIQDSLETVSMFKRFVFLARLTLLCCRGNGTKASLILGLDDTIVDKIFMTSFQTRSLLHIGRHLEKSHLNLVHRDCRASGQGG